MPAALTSTSTGPARRLACSTTSAQRVAEIGDQRVGGCSSAGELGHGRMQLGAAGVDAADRVAPRREGLRDGEPDAARRARDQHVARAHASCLPFVSGISA
jgi:hypothetical protein